MRPTTTVCLASNFVSYNACYNALNSQEQKAFAVYLKVLELAALGGTNYSAELGPSGTLNTDAAAYNRLTVNQRDIGRLVILADNADSSGATVPVTKAAIATAIECLKDFTMDALDRMELVLDCKLGRHAAIPQSDL